MVKMMVYSHIPDLDCSYNITLLHTIHSLESIVSPTAITEADNHDVLLVHISDTNHCH